MFVKKYAECLLAKDGDEVVGMALVSLAIEAFQISVVETDILNDAVLLQLLYLARSTRSLRMS